MKGFKPCDSDQEVIGRFGKSEGYAILLLYDVVPMYGTYMKTI